MAHNPLKMTIEEAKDEMFAAWSRSYSPERKLRSNSSDPQGPIERSDRHLWRVCSSADLFSQMERVPGLITFDIAGRSLA